MAKVRDSGMPDEATWEGFFNAEAVLTKLRCGSQPGAIVELGCGYGTFTIPAARRRTGTVYAFDIDPEMVAWTLQKTRHAGLPNVQAEVRDFLADGTGLPTGSARYCMAFNILHVEQPEVLLREALRVLREGGLLGIIHWNYDATTPRGPAMDIRPRPEECLQWAIDVGFRGVSPRIDLPPYHYGFVFERPSGDSVPDGSGTQAAAGTTQAIREDGALPPDDLRGKMTNLTHRNAALHVVRD